MPRPIEWQRAWYSFAPPPVCRLAPAHHLLVKARAGSGKTLTIAARTALLIEQEQLHPDQILLLVFNKKRQLNCRSECNKSSAIPNFAQPFKDSIGATEYHQGFQQSWLMLGVHKGRPYD